MIADHILNIIFPPKCILCQKLLTAQETDLCHRCRTDTEEFTKSKQKISFVAGWTSLWYYSGDVRKSILRYKFSNRRHYGAVYGRMLAMKLSSKPLCGYDILTWVPISDRRRWFRGFDQVELIARAVGEELGTPAVPVLKKIRHTKPQSRISMAAARRANVLGAYTVTEPELVTGKKILLLDDIITTGSTVSECARMLGTFGAEQVYCAAVAAPHDKKEKRR